jgi:sigma-B regulation protein RsbQ
MGEFPTSILERSNVVILGATGPGKKTIVFLHGLEGDQSMWRLITPAFENHYQLVLLDLIGASQTNPHAYEPATHGPLDDHATDLLAVLGALALHDTIFVGHSVAAMIGMLAAVREPKRFAKMVLISPSPRFINEADHASGFETQDINEVLTAMEGDYPSWQGFDPVMMTPQERPELVLELTNSFVRTNPEIAKHFARVAFFSDTRAEFGFLTIPTLIIQGTRDAIAPLAVGHYINEHLADSRLLVLETAGHCPHLSAPQEMLSAMDSCLHG